MYSRVPCDCDFKFIGSVSDSDGWLRIEVRFFFVYLYVAIIKYFSVDILISSEF